MITRRDRTYRAAVDHRWARYLALLLANPAMRLHGCTRTALLAHGYAAPSTAGGLRVTRKGMKLVDAMRAGEARR